ncbi:NAD(P)-dependent oxidoreductase [Virgibacillus phasianinus]|uniref:NAD(P)-dependent oxidoreductase n=1 Tax=Virgibacillus phasianinus TaxID=2017483 RepID=A0A220U036_9BACI|nr:SDR family oxidoreductase [Virgibacillus phasianinus]ASK61400.1 NAD(P)-dependent oxidoreductase [Virgibacillus phasianinus]
MDMRYLQTGGQPAQTQPKQPGLEDKMNPTPKQTGQEYVGSGKLTGKTALISGGDSGIGRAVAIAYAKEGAHVAITYLEEDSDAEETKRCVEAEGVQCLLIQGDVKDSGFCKEAVDQTVESLGSLNVLVNNTGVQYPQNSLLDISDEQWEETFQTNIFSFFYMTKAAIPHLKSGDTIIFTSSINAHVGNETLIDYTATKGAITAFARSMARSLAKDNIRVNTVAPGPIWTPLIPSTFDANKVAKFGTDTPLGRPGQPSELAGAYVHLASDESTYMTGQTIHINGGMYTSS